MAMIPYRRHALYNLMSDPFDAFFGTGSPSKLDTSLMRTDIRETDDNFEVVVDLPGFKKENVQLELDDDYLTITAQMDSETEDTKGTYVRKERFSGKCSRRFYVGEDIRQEDISAHFEDGLLKIDVPKKQPEPQVDEKRLISID